MIFSNDTEIRPFPEQLQKNRSFKSKRPNVCSLTTNIRSCLWIPSFIHLSHYVHKVDYIEYNIGNNKWMAYNGGSGWHDKSCLLVLWILGQECIDPYPIPATTLQQPLKHTHTSLSLCDANKFIHPKNHPSLLTLSLDTVFKPPYIIYDYNKKFFWHYCLTFSLWFLGRQVFFSQMKLLYLYVYFN